jgi:PAS domain-containing protein
MFAEIHEEKLEDVLRHPASALLLALWDVARKGRRVPVRAAFEAQPVLATMLDDLMILDRQPDGDLLYRHYGSQIAAHAGFDMTGKRVSDFKGVLGVFYREVYARAIEERRTFVTLHRLGHFRERPLWERLILPLADVGDAVTTLVVVNRVRELDEDIPQIRVRQRGNGLLVLQFIRDAAGEVTDAVIAGANQAARQMTGRRLDELIDVPIREAFPAVVDRGLYEAYLAVGRSRQPRNLIVDYDADGVSGRFDVLIRPITDGVAIDIRLIV